MMGYQIHQHGLEIRRNQLCEKVLDSIKREIGGKSQYLKSSGIRHIEKKFPCIQSLVQHPAIVSIAEEVLDDNARLVRALYFDKTPTRNWFVSWHQDKTVTLNQKLPLKGWRSWSYKEGVYHVQPPLEVLQKMITLRVHIDPSDRYNGCLKVIPGSHKQGILDPSEIQKTVNSSDVVNCEVSASDILLMRPHLLHCSPKAEKPSHRRVVHLEFSAYDLPPNISWA